MDIVIPVGPRLLMDKTNCMHHLMKYSSQSLAALADRDILITTLSTHKRITPNERKKKSTRNLMILKRRGKSTSATIATEIDTHRPSGQFFVVC